MKSCIYTVSQMAKVLELSRARFYQLINAGIMPPPAYHPQTRQPIYPPSLQEVCREIRETGIGHNGEYIRFYRLPKTTRSPQEYGQIKTILRDLGLSVTTHDIKKALSRLGLTARSILEDTTKIRMLFQYLSRSKGV